VKKIAAVLVLIALAGLGIQKAIVIFSGPPDYSGTGTTAVTVEITKGQSLATIGNTLKSAQIVKSVDSFISACNANPKSGNIQPGVYELKLQMSSVAALESLISGTSRVSNKVVVPEGKRLTWILERIHQKTKLSIADLQASVGHADTLGLPQYAAGNVEGFLFPATYTFAPTATADEVIKAMLDKFNEQSAVLNLERRASAIGKTPYEIITVASLLQVEAHPRDFAKVSRVVYNRLKAPMRLQFDSTVNYGLKKEDVILTTAQLAIDTPYNMYLHDGLPPTPIDSPGAAAIEAALTPDTGDWLYFITTNLDTQETKFTNSYSAFLTYKSEFLAYCSAHQGKCY